MSKQALTIAARPVLDSIPDGWQKTSEGLSYEDAHKAAISCLHEARPVQFLAEGDKFYVLNPVK